AVFALAGIQPLLEVHAGDRPVPGNAGIDIVLSRLGGARRTLRFVQSRRSAARLDDFTSAPATRQVVGGRLRAARLATVVEDHLVPVAVLLRVPVARHDLDEELLLRVMHGGRQLLVPGRSGGRVQTPGVAVWDDDGVETPLVELVEELARGRGRLVAVAR